MDEIDHEQIYNFLVNKVYPEHVLGKSERNCWRRRCAKFTMKDQKLYYKNREHGDLRVIKLSEMNKIIEEYHIENGLHRGSNFTRRKIMTEGKYKWPKIAESVQDYVRDCKVCAPNRTLRLASKYKQTATTVPTPESEIHSRLTDSAASNPLPKSSEAVQDTYPVEWSCATDLAHPNDPALVTGQIAFTCTRNVVYQSSVSYSLADTTVNSDISKNEVEALVYANLTRPGVVQHTADTVAIEGMRHMRGDVPGSSLLGSVTLAGDQENQNTQIETIPDSVRSSLGSRNYIKNNTTYSAQHTAEQFNFPEYYLPTVEDCGVSSGNLNSSFTTVLDNGTSCDTRLHIENSHSRCISSQNQWNCVNNTSKRKRTHPSPKQAGRIKVTHPMPVGDLLINTETNEVLKC